jgi:hypothetical protein
MFSWEGKCRAEGANHSYDFLFDGQIPIHPTQALAESCVVDISLPEEATHIKVLATKFKKDQGPGGEGVIVKVPAGEPLMMKFANRSDFAPLDTGNRGTEQIKYLYDLNESRLPTRARVVPTLSSEVPRKIDQWSPSGLSEAATEALLELAQLRHQKNEGLRLATSSSAHLCPFVQFASFPGA